MTQATQMVLRAILTHPGGELYGRQICQATGLPGGTVHPILVRLAEIGWLVERWEEVDPREAGRPRRRYYWLSADGAAKAKPALAKTRPGAAPIA
jgi:DNA-binding PadR family transcriptional regulator